MVRIEDITEEMVEGKKNIAKKVALIRDFFDDSYYIVSDLNGISIQHGGKDIAILIFDPPQMEIYSPRYLNLAKQFAEKYEHLFHSQKEFLIQIDYS